MYFLVVFVLAPLMIVTGPVMCQRLLYGLQTPVKRLVLNRMESRQRQARVFTEEDISPFHWVNTRPPDLQQSPEWIVLRDNDFKEYRLEVGGLVREPRSFSIDDRKAISSQDQITMRTCMQGWTGIAKWSGSRFGRCSPRSNLWMTPTS